VLGAVIGLPTAYWFSRCSGKSLIAAETIINFPLVMPPTVLGYFLLVLLGVRSSFGQLYNHLFHAQLSFTWQGAAVAASVASVPLLVSHARLAFASVEREVQDSARMCGATEAAVFFRITLPLARPGVIAGLSLAFARALGDFGATLMFAGDTPGATRTMPLAVVDALEYGDTRSVLLFVVVACILSLVFSAISARFARQSV